MIKTTLIKTSGYVISTVSVLLLGAVSLKTAKTDPVLAICLLGGMLTSICGMFFRWWSYRIEENAKQSAGIGSKAQR